MPHPGVACAEFHDVGFAPPPYAIVVADLRTAVAGTLVQLLQVPQRPCRRD